VFDKDIVMRHLLIVPALLLATSAIAATGPASGDDVLKPVSVRMTEAGRAALAKGDASAAIDAFEAALASDPKNVAAFNGMAQAYEKLGLPGKAVKFYREALVLNPSDIAALEGQGKALIARGATARAQVNLARIKAVCKTDCAAAERLQLAINTATAPPPAKTVATKN
jgi:Tfp pilus assembly protein PilF